MPVEFLTDEQAEAYGAFAEVARPHAWSWSASSSWTTRTGT
nr:hypothetical protein [Streptomyces albicerus]